jgi:hypothetical protein
VEIVDGKVTAARGMEEGRREGRQELAGWERRAALERDAFLAGVAGGDLLSPIRFGHVFVVCW